MAKQRLHNFETVCPVICAVVLHNVIESFVKMVVYNVADNIIAFRGFSQFLCHNWPEFITITSEEQRIVHQLGYYFKL